MHFAELMACDEAGAKCSEPHDSHGQRDNFDPIAPVVAAAPTGLAKGETGNILESVDSTMGK
jgi:hypothetical protein